MALSDACHMAIYGPCSIHCQNLLTSSFVMVWRFDALTFELTHFLPEGDPEKSPVRWPVLIGFVDIWWISHGFSWYRHLVVNLPMSCCMSPYLVLKSPFRPHVIPFLCKCHHHIRFSPHDTVDGCEIATKPMAFQRVFQHDFHGINMDKPHISQLV